MNPAEHRHSVFARQRRVALFALMLMPLCVAGQSADIHRCPQADGTVAFQELPCPEPAQAGGRQADPQSNGDDESPRDELVDVDDAVDANDKAPAPATPASKKRAECEKSVRDAIDAIDAELRTSGTEEAREAYLGELLELTRQLRACKQLPASRSGVLREQPNRGRMRGR